MSKRGKFLIVIGLFVVGLGVSSLLYLNNQGTFKSFADTIKSTAQNTAPSLFGTSSTCQTNGTGLTGKYYEGSTLKTTRTDQKIDFNWGSNSPATGVSPDHFKVHWSGYLESCYSENYKFTIQSDDGVKLFIDSNPVIDQYTNGAKYAEGNFFLTAGSKHKIDIYYYDYNLTAKIQLYWQSSHTRKQIIPQAHLYPDTGNQPDNNLQRLSLRVKSSDCDPNNLPPYTDTDCRINGIQIKASPNKSVVTNNSNTSRNDYNGFIDNLPYGIYTLTVNSNANNPYYKSYFETKAIRNFQFSENNKTLDIYLNKKEATTTPTPQRGDFTINVYEGPEQPTKKPVSGVYIIANPSNDTTTSVAKLTANNGSVTFNQMVLDQEYTFQINADRNRDYKYKALQNLKLRPSDYLIVQNSVQKYAKNVFLEKEVSQELLVTGSIMDITEGINEPVKNLPVEITVYDKLGNIKSAKIYSKESIECQVENCNKGILKGNYSTKFNIIQNSISYIQVKISKTSAYQPQYFTKTIYPNSSNFSYDSILQMSICNVHWDLVRKNGTGSYTFRLKDTVTNKPIDIIKANEYELVFRYTNTISKVGYYQKNIFFSNINFNFDLFDYELMQAFVLIIDIDGYHKYTAAMEKLPLINKSAVFDIYLNSENNQQEISYCETINTIKFCTYKFAKDIVFDQNRIINLRTISLIYKNLAAQSNDNNFIIFIYPQKEFFPYAQKAEISYNQFGINNSAICLDLDFINNSYTNYEIYTLIHEYGHIIDFNKELTDNNKSISQFEKVVRTNSDNKCYDQYPGCFTDYQTTNIYETWADFFMLYALNNKVSSPCTSEPMTFRELINHLNSNKDPNNVCMSKECKNALLYLYQTLVENFPNLQSFELADTTSQSSSSKSIAMSQLSADAQTDNNQSVLGASTSNSEYLSLMRSLGYTPVSPIKIKTVAKLSDMNLTSNQIAEGVWIQENYNKLPLKDKVIIQVKTFTTQLSNYLAQSPPVFAVKQAVAFMNNLITNILTRAGIKTTAWLDISGKVVDQKNNPIRDAQIMVGNKTGYISRDGYYKVSGLERPKDGKLTIKVYDPKINKYFSVRVNSTITIPKNQKKDITNFNIKVTRSYNWFQGKVYDSKGKLLNTGILKAIYNNRISTLTCPINSKGVFNCALPHGKYSFALFHKGKRIYPKSTKNMPGHLLSDITTLTKITNAEIRLDR